MTVANFPSITLVYPNGARSTAELARMMVQNWPTVPGAAIKSQLTQINQTTCQTSW
jgi:hypothetical protein